jgi:hypothetical protein
MDAVLARSTAPAETVEPTQIVGDIGDIIGSAIRAAIVDADRRAAVCGCRGCKAQARQATEWGRSMLGSGETFGV